MPFDCEIRKKKRKLFDADDERNIDRSADPLLTHKEGRKRRIRRRKYTITSLSEFDLDETKTVSPLHREPAS